MDPINKTDKEKNVRTRILLSAILLGFVYSCGLQTGWTQDSKPKASVPDLAVNAYHLDFSINELEEGKKINSRQYSMNLNNNESNEIRIGTRVPVEPKQGEFQYLDVGTKIWCSLKERENGLALEVRSDISNFAIGDQANQGSRPLLRQMQINGSTIAQPAKPIVIGSVDDPNSKRKFQLEVTATRLR